MAKKTKLKDRTSGETLYPITTKDSVLDLTNASETESGLMSNEDKINLENLISNMRWIIYNSNE